MDKRKFYVVGIVAGVITFLLDFFALPVESIIVGIVSLVLNIRKRKEYRTLIGIILTILGIIGSIGFLVFLFQMEADGLGETSYWLCRLLFH